MAIFIQFVIGLIFGLGLIVSGMSDPAKVLNFLDVGGIPAGTWDASLAFVMAGAVAVTFIGFGRILRRARPFLAERFYLPTRTDIDSRIVAGPAILRDRLGIGGVLSGAGADGARIRFFFRPHLRRGDVCRHDARALCRQPAVADALRRAGRSTRNLRSLQRVEITDENYPESSARSPPTCRKMRNDIPDDTKRTGRRSSSGPFCLTSRYYQRSSPTPTPTLTPGARMPTPARGPSSQSR